MCYYEVLNPGVFAYTLSLAFQVAGAVLLIIKYFGRTKERIIDEYFPGSNYVKYDENENVTLEKNKVQECVQRIYSNRMAFVFIVIGYILSIFGIVPEKNKGCILVFVIVGTIIIILLGKGISVKISKLLYKEDIIRPYKDVEDKAEIAYSSEEIAGLFQD